MSCFFQFVLMRAIAYTLIFLFFLTPAYAQQRDTAIAGIHYVLKHMTDSTKPTVFRTENMVQYIGQRMNVFMSLDKIKRDSVLMSGNYQPDPARPIKPVITTEIVNDKASSQLVVKEYLFKNYYYAMPYPDIRWTITKEKKQVGGYSCTKAEGYYKGRTYHAWFTTDTKLQSGLWRLTGLPGVVLEAYDTRRQVIFEFVKIETTLPADHNFIITTPPAQATATTRKDFYRMREAAWNDPQAAFNANNPGAQLNLTTQTGAPANIRLSRPLNPLELVDD